MALPSLVRCPMRISLTIAHLMRSTYEDNHKMPLFVDNWLLSTNRGTIHLGQNAMALLAHSLASEPQVATGGARERFKGSEIAGK